MADPTRPFLVLYVVWHPDFAHGSTIADALREHFRRKLYENVAGGMGLSVIYRFAPAPGAAAPLPIDLNEAETTAIVVLADSSLTADAVWTEYVQMLAKRTEEAGLGTRIFPVAIEAKVPGELGLAEQALRWDRWTGSLDERCHQLTAELTYEFCRMLRHYLEHLKHATEDESALNDYLKKVQIFLSHSKHDEDGERIAHAVRDRLHGSHGLMSFFDVHDIPAGLRFNKVLLQQVRVSAMVAIHTDSYSSREWCRREVIEAKRWNVPLVVTNSITDLDERGFPYMGNVPVVRLEPKGVDRIDFVIRRLLDEVLKDFLWRCRVELARGTVDSAVVFIPRPPELISLAGLPTSADMPRLMIVYPDPPLSAEEERLFAEISPHVQLRSMTEWLAGALR
ncbi:toll/interleukin-1 receptor domain-containing protein [Cupriavidus basilensis]|uniref:toll/interleukin-1 receptor domain-containing protein n=1 Tax=Cupriavidus basilensis TaxID=68895 RepID=UPI0023E8B293|nr:toll/interleukin-1 receptor domain-containing protein [Cupriavidus basilensis]MDF3883638.1 toll/interleukin-1 receptor domain-containing protein [Cupriavidus basilensis]